ncbi:MAG TPA: methionyl-tRNA formyltransferase [Acidimicrobiales bacterium]|jgi:methionyl-tRNA formyltransferase|nr:methionyl-tRNA formyltransferase [Acidimicrobiales bacterium]
MARLVFLGTPEAAVAPLRTLVEAGHDVGLVVTRPDKRRGRGGALHPSPVKAAATELGLRVTDRLEDVPSAGAELGVVVAYGRIIPVAVLHELPMVNLHFSLLPRWRGAAPVERAILEGDAETGVCLMEVEAGLDTGRIYARADTTIDDDETADELRSRLVDLGCRLLADNLADGVAGLPVPRDQVGVPSYAEKIQPAELEIRWAQTAERIRRVVRLGRAWTTWRGHRLGVLAVEALTMPGYGPSEDGRVPGTLEGHTVVTGGGTGIVLVSVQPEGRRPMAAADWSRGQRVEPGERLGP